jgi:small GTP-binding protein
VQIWDSAGQERFRSVTKTYYKRASGIIIAYDSCNLQSFLNIKTWISDIVSELGNNVPIVLASTKCDSSNGVVGEHQEKELEKESGLKIFKTSSKSSEGVCELFDFIIDKCIHGKGLSCRTGSMVSYNLVKKKKCCRGG